jgi:hypothetical protein
LRKEQEHLKFFHQTRDRAQKEVLEVKRMGGENNALLYQRKVEDATGRIRSLEKRIAEFEQLKSRDLPAWILEHDVELAKFNALPLIVLAGLK